MTMSLIHQIELAERGLTEFDIIDPRFVPAERASLRESFARAIRSSARSGLRLADRLDPACQAA
ncbi:MAG: hypothetical protein J0I14_04265 [Propionibacteriaceae bacterium]|jgi:hypothetical protein|nr:hypothetical protein [Propionibacteriaceae bacterium]